MRAFFTISCRSVLKYGLGAFLFVSFSFQPSRTDPYFEIIKGLDLFTHAYRMLAEHYVSEIDAVSLAEIGIRSMLDALDPYTVYIPENEVQKYQQQSNTHYQGIGVDVEAHVFSQDMDMGYVIVDVGLKARASGLRIGDRLLEINGLSLEGRSLLDVETLLRGKEGERVSLVLSRSVGSGVEKISREVARLPLGEGVISHKDMLSETVGYVRFDRFSPHLTRMLSEAIFSLEERGAEGLILDLRENPGGLLQEALSIANLFLPLEALLMSSSGRDASWNKEYYAKEEPLFADMLLVVLLSNRSASASEIVAGALQDHDRAVIVGNTSYGKGLVQRVLPLVYGAQMKITMARYLTPSGRYIQGVGHYAGTEQTAEDKAQAFYTSGGRKVYNKGGIEPDIALSRADSSVFLQRMEEGHFVFNYATYYAGMHPVFPENFHKKAYQDSLFNAFYLWIMAQKPFYQSHSMSLLDSLAQSLSASYSAYDSSIKSLRSLLRKEIEDTFRAHKALLLSRLHAEIIRRYESHNEALTKALLKDKETIIALELLHQPEKLQAILSP